MLALFRRIWIAGQVGDGVTLLAVAEGPGRALRADADLQIDVDPNHYFAAHAAEIS